VWKRYEYPAHAQEGWENVWSTGYLQQLSCKLFLRKTGQIPVLASGILSATQKADVSQSPLSVHSMQALPDQPSRFDNKMEPVATT
jgi:hypothetical protein